MKSRYRYLPLLLYLGYVSFVFIVVYLGPLKYKNFNVFLVGSYVAFVSGIFSVGYIVGSSGRLYSVPERFKHLVVISESKSMQRWISLLLSLGFLIVFVACYNFIVGGGSINFNSLGENYIESYKGYERGQAVVNFSYILNILSLSVMSILLYFISYYYQVLDKKKSYFFIFIAIVFLIVQVLGSGKQKYLGDFVICFAFYLIFLLVRTGKRLRLRQLLFAITGIAFCFFLFMEILSQRYEAAGIGVHNIYSVAHPLVYWDLNSPFFSVFGDRYGFALGIFLGYFTNGVYGLSLCLELPFEWTYFVGNSYSLTRLVEIGLGEKGLILQSTYPYRAGVEYGWDASKWHSLYAWMASDFTFPGVAIVAGIFGAFYGKLWVESLNTSNVFSGPLFIMFSLGLIFSLANNQLMHSLSGVITFLFFVTLWLTSKLGRYLKEGRKRKSNYSLVGTNNED